MVPPQGKSTRATKAGGKPAGRKPAKRESPLRTATATPRLPQRASGRARFEILVDATDKLLGERDAGEISLYDIAAIADVPAASVYHFFPSTAAAFVALAQRYLTNFRDIVAEPVEHASLAGWQDIFHTKGMQAVRFYNEHPIVCKLFLGSEYSWQIRLADIESNRDFGQIIADLYQKHFEITSARGLIEEVEIGIGISDSILSLSYQRHGFITDFYAQEAQRAYDAYIGLYLAPFLPRRAEPLPD